MGDNDGVTVADSMSSDRTLSLLSLGVDIGSFSGESRSSMTCPGVDSILIIDGELNIFGGELELNVSEDLNK